MHTNTLVGKLVALSVEKYYMALTKIQLKICRFHGSLSQKGPRSLKYYISWIGATGLNLLQSMQYIRFSGVQLTPISASHLQCKLWKTWFFTASHLCMN